MWNHSKNSLNHLTVHDDSPGFLTKRRGRVIRISTVTGPHHYTSDADSAKRVRDDEVMGWGYLIGDNEGTFILGPAKYLK